MPDFPHIIQFQDRSDPDINAERNRRDRQDKKIVEDGNQNRQPHKGNLFENRIWRLFDYFENSISKLSVNRRDNETIYFWGSENGQSQQIDGLFLGKENKLAFCIEATTVQSGIDEKIDQAILDKKRMNNNGFANYLITNYGTKQLFHIFACDQKLTTRQKNTLEEAGILPLDITKVDYLEAIENSYTKKYNRLAFANFLCHVLNQRVKIGNDTWVRATRYKSALTNGFCYAFSTNPSRLIDLTTVIHRTQDEGLNETYQRFIRPNKLKDVKEYLTENDRQFPNNIILSSESLSNSNFKELVIPKKWYENNKIDSSELDKSCYGLLKLPNVYGDLHIIDGQHRLFGYDQSQKEDKHFLNVLMYDKSMLDIDKMRIFKDVNENQTPLDSSIVWELHERTLEGATDKPSILKRSVSKFFNKYLKDEKFKLYHRLKPGIPIANSSQKNVNATMAQICEVVSKYKANNKDISLFQFLMDHDSLGKIEDNPESPYFGNHHEISKLFHDYFLAIEELYPTEFDLNSKGVVLFGSIFVCWFEILYEILNFWDINGHLETNLRTRSGRVENFKSILSNFVENELKILDNEDKKKDFRKLYYGGARKNLSILIAARIREIDEYKDFAPNLKYKGSSEIEAILDILNSNHENLDLEVKTSIYSAHRDPSSPEIEQKAEEQLESVNMLHNTHGGRVIIGITDDLEIVGCQDEVARYNNVAQYKTMITRKILSMSDGKIRATCSDFNYDGKTIVVIRVPRIRESVRTGTNLGMLNVTYSPEGEISVGIPQFVEHKYDKVKEPAGSQNTKLPVAYTRVIGPRGPEKLEITASNMNDVVERLINERETFNYFDINDYLFELESQNVTASEFEGRNNRIYHK